MRPAYRISGMTLLEIMLVFAIMASFILFSINQYQQFKLESSFMDIKTNVDVLFQAMGRFYQGNCRNLSDYSVATEKGVTPTIIPGALAPAPNGPLDYSTPNLTYPIDIETQLISYLPNNWPTFVPEVDTTNGYTASFIFFNNAKNAYQCWWVPSAKKVSCGAVQAIEPNQPNKVAFWLVQVSVKISNDLTGDKTKVFLGATGASCASSKPDVCDASGTLNYLIWQQLPTKSGSAINSDLWVSQSQEVMFNQQYTHDVMYEMATPDYYTSNTPYTDQYYLCGN